MRCVRTSAMRPGHPLGPAGVPLGPAGCGSELRSALGGTRGGAAGGTSLFSQLVCCWRWWTACRQHRPQLLLLHRRAARPRGRASGHKPGRVIAPPRGLGEPRQPSLRCASLRCSSPAPPFLASFSPPRSRSPPHLASSPPHLSSLPPLLSSSQVRNPTGSPLHRWVG